MHTRVYVPTQHTLLLTRWAHYGALQVGYGDINPKTTPEVVACIWFMILGAYLFSYVVGNMSNLIGQLGGDEAAFREKMEAVTVFMHDHHVPQDLKLRVRKYYDYSFSNPYVEATTSELVRNCTGHTNFCFRLMIVDSGVRGILACSVLALACV